MDGPSFAAGIFDLATRRMCGPACHHAGRWALTPPFHPCLCRGGHWRSFSVTLIPGVAAGFPLENAVPCVARTFLFMLGIERQTTFLPFCKVTHLFYDMQVPANLRVICLLPSALWILFLLRLMLFPQRLRGEPSLWLSPCGELGCGGL